MKKYPIGVQDFQSLIENGYCYVDKTAYLYEMVNAGKYYLFSRPRRFGKSLMLSTLKAYFEGKKELFKGLAIDQLEQDWKSYPVFYLDLNVEKYDSIQSLEDRLNLNLEKWEALYGKNPSEKSLPTRFEGVITRAVQQIGFPVVLLVDEYDKPILHALDNQPLQEEFRNLLQAFYSPIKSQDACVKFCLFTGITKIGKMSVFSALNNLRDISMHRSYTNLCGITEQELHRYFRQEIQQFAESEQEDVATLCRQLKDNYDGYHFADHVEGVYNPFSLFNAFDTMRLSSFWFETGTPTYLVRLLQRQYGDLQAMLTGPVDEDVLRASDASVANPLPVLYQCGYLTIKDYDKATRSYTLKFPNREVEEGFMKFILPYYIGNETENKAFEVVRFVRDIKSGNVDAFMLRLQSLMSDINYQLISADEEKYYQNIFFILCKVLGFYVDAEYCTSSGRIDLLLRTNEFVYIFEFKYAKNSEVALNQIEDKNYAMPFAIDSRKIMKVGVNISSTTHTISDWKINEH